MSLLLLSSCPGHPHLWPRWCQHKSCHCGGLSPPRQPEPSLSVCPGSTELLPTSGSAPSQHLLGLGVPGGVLSTSAFKGTSGPLRTSGCSPGTAEPGSAEGAPGGLARPPLCPASRDNELPPLRALTRHLATVACPHAAGPPHPRALALHLGLQTTRPRPGPAASQGTASTPPPPISAGSIPGRPGSLPS